MPSKKQRAKAAKAAKVAKQAEAAAQQPNTTAPTAPRTLKQEYRATARAVRRNILSPVGQLSPGKVDDLLDGFSQAEPAMMKGIRSSDRETQVHIMRRRLIKQLQDGRKIGNACAVCEQMN